MAFKSRWLSPLLLALISAAVCADEPKPAVPKASITISKETTFITEPLRKDGFIDYIAALNDRCRKGVTPENNSAVLFWQAVGPGQLAAENRDEYFKMLDMPRPPDKGDYFIPLEKYIEQWRSAWIGDAAPREREIKAANEFLESSSLRPWSKREFPLLGDWLAANEKPLALAVEASRRPRRYDPMIVPTDKPLLFGLLPAVQQHREIARALMDRALLRAGEGQFDAARDDLLAIHRLARLAGQGFTLIDGLVGTAIDGIACAGDQTLLQQAKLSKAEAIKMLDELNKLPPIFKTAEKIDIGERFSMLDALGNIARQGFDSIAGLTGGTAQNARNKELSAAIAAGIDWDIVLRLANSWYDRMADAAGKPTFNERARALRDVDRDLRELGAKAKDFGSMIFPLLANPRKAVSRRIGEIFIALLLPAVQAVSAAEDRGEMQFAVTKLGYALAAYRAERGSYPAKLAELVPKFVAEVPKDVFLDAELHYMPDGDGYLLYSVGRNGRDDNGRGYNEAQNGEDWDDLAIRVPDSKKAKK